MVFDGFFNRALINELIPLIVGGRVSKIFQPFEKEVHFVIRKDRQNHRLRISIHPTYFNFGLTADKPNNPTHAPMFCMILRKYLENSILLNIKQLNNDRITILDFSGIDELGDEQTYQLIIEMMGRHSNVSLIHPTKMTIIDCIKHVSPSINSYRTLQPGASYRFPPTHEQQTNIFDLPDLSSWLLQNHKTIMEGNGHQIIQGMSPVTAQKIKEQALRTQKSLPIIFQELKDALTNRNALILETEKQPVFYFYDFDEKPLETFDSLSALLEAFFYHKIHQDRISQITGDIQQKLKDVLQKNSQKLLNLHIDKERALQADNYRIKGELLKTYAYQISKGSHQVQVENYYDNQQLLTIELDPRLTAIENSQRYFKQYAKYRDALKYIDHQIALANQENDYIESILVQLSQSDIEDIEEIKQELKDQGYVAQRKTTLKKRVKTEFKPRRFLADDGTEILVGKNNLQNDRLSLKKAHKNFWWLHAKNIPGSHVIINHESPSDQTITLAAELAAYYSKFSQSAMVPVDKVQVKHLRKPNGAKPGYVIYEGQQTLYVTPDWHRLQSYEVK